LPGNEGGHDRLLVRYPTQERIQEIRIIRSEKIGGVS
jgi:hypothetical protein